MEIELENSEEHYSLNKMVCPHMQHLIFMMASLIL